MTALSVFRAARPRLAALMVATILLAPAVAGAQTPVGPCWKRPAPETMEEIFKMSGASAATRRQEQLEQDKPVDAVLLISNGAQKIAYGAGLLVGWADAGQRPRFAAVTGVGAGALIAPFAFIGKAGDQAMADIFNCRTGDFEQLARQAAAMVDDRVIAAIAREYAAGRRLYVGLPGSAARGEAVWDIGRLASSKRPNTAALVGEILRASVFLHQEVASAPGLAAFMQTFPSNPLLRETGAGQEFLLPPQSARITGAGTRYYLIHNDRLFWDESEKFIAVRAGQTASVPSPIVPGYDVVRLSQKAGGFGFALPKSATGITPSGDFDPEYLKALFHHAYRHTRMGREWSSDFPGLRQGKSAL